MAGFSVANIAVVPDEAPITLEPVDGSHDPVTHVLRGLDATEFALWLEKQQRAGLPLEDVETSDGLRAKHELVRAVTFGAWDELILRAEGYPEIEGASLEDTKRFFRGEGPAFATLSAAQVKAVRDLLYIHVRSAVMRYAQQNTARWSFR